MRRTRTERKGARKRRNDRARKLQNNTLSLGISTVRSYDSMERASVRGKKSRSDKVVLPCIATTTRMGEKQSETFN